MAAGLADAFAGGAEGGGEKQQQQHPATEEEKSLLLYAAIAGGDNSKKKKKRSGGAYVTFLAGSGGDYVKGVVGLAKGLRKVGSAYPLVVAALPDVPEEHRRLLRSQGCHVREVDPIRPPHNNVHFAMPYYVINYSKMRVFQLEEFSKMVFLDADIMVYENIDHLFDTPDGYLYAVMDCFCEKTWSHSPQYSVGYCQQCPEKKLKVVEWPAHDPRFGPRPPYNYFNSGMFVFEPSLLTSQAILDALQLAPITPFAEQDFMNIFFEKIYKPIPVEYNLILAMLWRHPENFQLDKAKVVHYCAAGSKPWKYTGKEDNMNREDITMLIARWWDIYNDESLDFKPDQDVDVPEGDQKLSRPSIMPTAMPEPTANPSIPAAC